VVERFWLDANVILRFLTKDPPDIAKRAAGLFKRAENNEIALLITHLTLAEVYWVLKSFYKQRVDEICRVLLLLVSAPGIEIFDRELIIRSLEFARDKNVDFADALLALQAALNNETVCSFDEADFQRLPAKGRLP
jgi:predicted nucleic acid-binding protein